MNKPKNLYELIESGEIKISVEEAKKLLAAAFDFTKRYTEQHCAVCDVELILGKNYEPTHLLTYHYVTGRAGRTSFAEKAICEQHAQKYLKKEEGS